MQLHDMNINIKLKCRYKSLMFFIFEAGLAVNDDSELFKVFSNIGFGRAHERSAQWEAATRNTNARRNKSNESSRWHHFTGYEHRFRVIIEFYGIWIIVSE